VPPGACNNRQCLEVYLPEGTDEAGETHNATVCKQLGDLGDTSDVLLTVLVGEAEVLVEAVSHVVPIETVGWDPVAHQVLL